MNVLAVIMLGFAPGLFWLWLIYQRDRYIPAPRHLVVRTFLWGIAASIPVSLVGGALVALVGFDLQEGPKPSLAQVAYVSFVVAGMTEELAKYLAVKRSIYNSPYFRQPLDGIIFSAAAALGFASIENVGYMFGFGAAVILVRGPFSTLAHVLFAVTWGYFLGARKQGRVGAPAVGLSLLAAMALHGLFNFLLFAGSAHGLWALALFFATGAFFLFLVRDAQRKSPYRGKVASVQVTCPYCMHRSGYGAAFCTTCGQSLTLAKLRAGASCDRCDSLVGERQQFCTACGSRLDRKLVSPPTQ